ncbi:ectoine hydroxylase [Neptunomonas sp.]|uniref:ectoine hydroxylase n=1 Tax=Neptunomonas sp. TaxID=1971898 RepID=UPI00356AA99A
MSNDIYPSRQEQTASLTLRKDPVLYSEKTENAPLTANLLDQFEEQGYMLLADLFSPQEVATFSEAIKMLQQDDAVRQTPQAVTEADNGLLRSVFQIHQNHPLFANVAKDERITDIARFILGGDIYIHQSRLNFKPGLKGKEFYWHSDFETWHVEDGMPRMRALSCSIFLTDNNAKNGALMLMPGSHKEYLSCIGETPKDHYLQSLKQQTFGIPDDDSLHHLADKYGIDCAEAKAGSVLFFDCNTMHGSNSNITPDPRSNLFFVFNHIDNKVTDPFCTRAPRPEFIATRKNITAL